MMLPDKGTIARLRSVLAPSSSLRRPDLSRTTPMFMLSKSTRAIGRYMMRNSSRAVYALPYTTKAIAQVPSQHSSTHFDQNVSRNETNLSYTWRQFSSVNNKTPSIKLYQYHICPFCNITKSAMHYANLEYETVEVNPLTKAELKPWSASYKKVPIAIINETQINGSEAILDSILTSPIVGELLAKKWSVDSNDNKEVMTMQQFKDSENAKRWFRFAADDLGAVLYPNICGTLSDSFDAFSYVKDVDSFTGMQKMSIQYLGSLAMYFAASKVKSKRNIADEKLALQSALDEFENEGLQNGSFPFASRNPHTPDMGDLAVFGLLYAIRDMKAHADAVLKRGGVVKDWYERMKKIVVQ